MQHDCHFVSKPVERFLGVFRASAAAHAARAIGAFSAMPLREVFAVTCGQP